MPRHLLALDGSRSAEAAIPCAIAAARALGAEIDLVRVLEHQAQGEERPIDSVSWRLSRAEATAYLEEWKAHLEESGISTSVQVREGRAAEQVIEAARESGADLVVLSARGGGRSTGLGADGLPVGGTAQRVVAAGATSILMVRGVEPAAAFDPDACCKSVLVPVDGSRRGDWALSVAASIARARGARLSIAHVVPVPELVGSAPPSPEDLRLCDRLVARNRKEAEAYLHRVRENFAPAGVTVETRLVVAPGVARAIAAIAREEAVDLVVLCAHGGGCPGEAAAAPYGSVATGLLAIETPSLLVLQDVPQRVLSTAAPQAPTTVPGPAEPLART